MDAFIAELDECVHPFSVYRNLKNDMTAISPRLVIAKATVGSHPIKYRLVVIL